MVNAGSLSNFLVFDNLMRKINAVQYCDHLMSLMINEIEHFFVFIINSYLFFRPLSVHMLYIVFSIELFYFSYQCLGTIYKVVCIANIGCFKHWDLKILFMVFFCHA